MENSIHARRKAAGLSQQELAKRCGVSRQTINAIENNKYDPTLALAFALAHAQQSMRFSRRHETPAYKKTLSHLRQGLLSYSASTCTLMTILTSGCSLMVAL